MSSSMNIKVTALYYTSSREQNYALYFRKHAT